MAASDVNGAGLAAEAVQASNRPKRVRTGCLTCRERHLKCDEGLPACQNCRKSNRVCKRGVRLNFIDTQVQNPPIIPPTVDWNVHFQDESRDIASEYKGGISRYAVLDPTPPENNPPLQSTLDPALEFPSAPVMQPQSLPPIQSHLSTPYSQTSLVINGGPPRDHRHAESNSDAGSYTNPNFATPQTSYGNADRNTSPSNETRDYLQSPEEVLFMQVFVEEVGLWMDSMDPMKHFSRLLPFHSLGEPMLLNAFLACGARHLTLVNPAYHEDKALHYYDTATRGLLNSLQDPNRDTVICATTAVILNVYEIMSERALQRMNHIAGARALIKECGWSARSTGIGAACFWLNVGMELLSCLHFNWQVAWEPDDWGVDMDFSRETESGREEIWTHRIVYIVGKIANFRASIPRFQEPNPRDEQYRFETRHAEWMKLKSWCDSWNENVPRTMHPMAYLYSYQTTSKSAFPEVWLIKRSTIVARLFYHTAMCLLAQINPAVSKETDEMHEMQMSHSHQICGIAAHVKDRGVASVAIRSLAIAAECLVVRREQEEVLQVFDKIRKETGWRVEFLHKELKEKWGWNREAQEAAALQQQQQQQQQQNAMMTNSAYAQAFSASAPASGAQHSTSSSTSSLPSASALQPPPPPPQPAPQRRAMPVGIVNPMYSNADFSSQHHPYQSHYVAPAQHGGGSSFNF